MSAKMKVLVIATRFPSTIQPWLANSTAQVVKHGENVEIFAMEEGDKTYAKVVDDYQLLSHTTILNFHGKNILKAIACNFLNPHKIVASLKGIFIAPKYFSSHKSLINSFVGALVLAPHFVKKNIDLIHSHFEITGHKLLPFIKAQGVPFVITFHGLPPPGVALLPEQMRAEYVDAADVILVNTEFAKRQYVHLGAPADKIQILPQGIVTNDYIFSTKEKPLDKPIQILTVGRFHADKGHKYVLHALPELIKRGHKIHYTMVGTGPDKALLEQISTELGLQDVVSFHTSISEAALKDIYAKSHIFILPSLKAIDGFHEETQGVAIQEAQASGLIVVATKVGGIPECVEDGKSAFLIEDRNAEAITDKLQWIIDNPQHWNQWQRDARHYVETHFDIDVIGDRLMKIYSDAITNASKANK
jgi:colanic acid/amylovoran biosynthesis glycosyltransferase